MKSKKLSVYDAVNKKYTEVEVSDEVYTYYKRTGWAIENNDRSFYEHEIQFSMLKGGTDGAFENFHEFIAAEDVTEKYIMTEGLNKALKMISSKDRELIELLYYKEMTERECAAYYGISQKNIHKKKVRILDNLHKLLGKA
ncbi:sigma factor-like helix-turn-helix DNA-binding protein [Ruminococcus sp. Marseille-P6503]|uniref:RNA polymerase sigma factor n=1 Tax=Ruminococcus sp. Marseille-P6503 TaxID=2364796 RepID=UPI000F51F306|nr:sigma factor-like helix-turn-helix DNA-binding protein [Ruminococcus sp. Marseille-P6503]